MGWFALIPAWTHAREDFQNSQPVISCHRVKRSCSLFFHSEACHQKPAEIILRFVCSVNMYLKFWIQMTTFEEKKPTKTPNRANPLTETLIPPWRWIKKHCYEIPVQILLWTKSKCFGDFGIQIWSSMFQPICSIQKKDKGKDVLFLPFDMQRFRWNAYFPIFFFTRNSLEILSTWNTLWSPRSSWNDGWHQEPKEHVQSICRKRSLITLWSLLICCQLLNLKLVLSYIWL